MALGKIGDTRRRVVLARIGRGEYDQARVTAIMALLPKNSYANFVLAQDILQTIHEIDQLITAKEQEK